VADLQKTIDIIFQGYDKTGTALSSVGRNITSVSDKVEAIAQPFATIADYVLKADTALTALAGAGLVYAYNKSKDFESATIDLQKVLSDTSGMENAKEQALNLSNEYGIAATAILESMAGLKQAGFNLADSITLTENAMQLTIAGEIDSAQAMDLLIATLKGFDAPASKAVDLLDSMNSVSTEYATNVQELATGMAELSPIAKTMGFSMEETEGILTPVIEVFRSGSEAAVALKTTLLKLVDDTPAVTNALESLGVSQKDSNGQFRTGKDILYDVMEAFSGLSDNQKAYTAMQLTGINQSGKAMTVFDNLSKVLAVTQTAYGKAYTAIDEVNLKLASSEYAVDRFRNAWANLAIYVGDGFRDAATEAINGGTEIEIALQNAVKDGSFDPLLNAFEGLSTDIGNILKDIAKNLPEALEGVDYSGLVTALHNLGTELVSFFSMDGTDPENLRSGIQGVVDVLTTLTNITSGIAAAFKPYIQGMIDAASGSESLSAETAKDFGEIIGNAKAIVSLGAEIAGVFLIAKEAGVDFGTTLVVSINGVALAVDGIQESFLLLKLGFLSIIDEILDGMKVLDDFVPFNLFGDGLDDASAAVKDWINDVENSLDENKSQIEKEIAAIDAAFAEIPDEKDVNISTNADGVKKDVDEIKAAVDSVPDEKTTEVDMDTIPAIDKMEELSTKTAEISDSTKWSAELDTASVETKAALVAKAIDWKGKIDLQNAEASMQQFLSLVGSVTTGIQSTGDVLQSILGLSGDNMEDLGFNSIDIDNMIDREYLLRQQEFEMQKALITAQLQLMAQKQAAIANGGGLIKIEADGLEPELEAFMFKVIEKVQVRVNEESSELLLGM